MQKLGNAEENEQARRKIAAALLRLMEKKPISQISIATLVKEADVARATYYRNFDSFESVVKEYTSLLQKDTLAVGIRAVSDELGTDSIKDQLRSTAAFLETKRQEILCLYNNGFGILLLEIINEYVGILLGDMPVHSVDRYKINFIAGGLFDVLMAWLKDESRETASDISAFCADYLTGVKRLL